VVFACLARALPVYQKNPSRPPVARLENIECSAAIMVLVTALESHVNRLMYFCSKGLSTRDSLGVKIEKYLSQKRLRSLCARLTEVTVCRDAIVHAHVWMEQIQVDSDWNIRRQRWEVATITHLLGKAKKNVLKKAPVTKRLKLNVVPTRVNFVDVAKALIVALCVLRELERKYGSPKAWLGPFPHDSKLAKIFLMNGHHDSWEDWVGGVLKHLHPPHLREVISHLKLKAVAQSHSHVSGGLGTFYQLGRRSPFLLVP